MRRDTAAKTGHPCVREDKSAGAGISSHSMRRLLFLGVASVLAFPACGEDNDRRVGSPEPDACADGGCDVDACADGGCEVDPCADGGCEEDACADGGCEEDACADGGCDAADAAPPRCGDGNTDEGEVCDDGNLNNGDGCQSDCTRSQCTTPAECSDGLFCNGAEECREGTCVPGTPPLLDDGIACTDDRCNEAAERADHTPNNARCSSLTTAPRCATTGTFAGRLTRQVGVCRAAGCSVEEQLVDDCLDDRKYPTSYLCAATPSRILRRDGACLSSPTPRCGYTDSVQTQCTSAIPSPHPFCSGTAAARNLTHHYNAAATCSGTPAACGYTESTSACAPGSPACSAGRLTTYTATCSASGGCGRQANAPTACPTGAATCSSLSGRAARRTYAPACNTAGTACATPGTPTDTACPLSNPTCGGTPATRTTYTATCAGAGVCGQTSSAQACPDQASVCQRNPASGIVSLTSYTPACTGTACGTPRAATRTCSGRLACSGRTLQRFSPTCNPSTDYCGPATSPSSTQDCALADSITCEPGSRVPDTLVTVRGVCDPTNGCGQTTTRAECAFGSECLDARTQRTHQGCRNSTRCVSTDRVCDQITCFGSQLWQETGCSGASCQSVLMRTCDQRVRCLPNGDEERETGCLASACTTSIIRGGCQIIN